MREEGVRTAGAVLALSRRVLGDPSLAEEIVQEVFIRLWNEPERFDPDRGFRLATEPKVTMPTEEKEVEKILTDAEQSGEDGQHHADPDAQAETDGDPAQ